MSSPSAELTWPPPEETVILVVDDLPQNLQVVGAMLRAAGYQVVPATSGEQALRFARNPSPDLVLLDVMMPDMEGFEVCRRLKAAPETAAIPVIFLTAAVETGRIVQGFGAGAVDYVTKPFNSAELLARVRTHLELKHSRETLERAARQLRSLDNEKNEFLGIVAHDLKNPICSFIGIAQYVLAKPGIERAELKELAEDILLECGRLLQLVQNLLDVNALEQGQLKVQLESCDLAELARTVVSKYQDKAAAKQQTLASDSDAPPSRVWADRGLTSQILDNLVSNALKFSPAGRPVTLGITRVGGRIHCEVRDEGPGLSLEDQKRLFGKFCRLAARPTGGEHSTGLGLSIVKKLIEAMHGKVWCESELGQGSRFIISLPVGP
jgi:signal transduction histidine kinase